MEVAEKLIEPESVNVPSPLLTSAPLAPLIAPEKSVVASFPPTDKPNIPLAATSCFDFPPTSGSERRNERC